MKYFLKIIGTTIAFGLIGFVVGSSIGIAAFGSGVNGSNFLGFLGLVIGLLFACNIWKQDFKQELEQSKNYTTLVKLCSLSIKILKKIAIFIISAFNFIKRAIKNRSSAN